MSAFERDHLFWLILVALIPILGFIFYKKWKQKKLNKLGNAQQLKKNFHGAGYHWLYWKVAFFSAAILFLVLSIMNFRKGSGTEQVNRKGIDIVFALDLSKSMLAQDVSPDRLTRAKVFINQVLNKLKNDRVGLVVFAGKAYLQSPITQDRNAIKMLLEAVNPNMIPTQGTVMADAIKIAKNAFNQNEKKHKSLVIISDGEDHDANAINAAEDALETGVITYTIGVGTPEGTSFIDPVTGALKLNRQGTTVVSKLNEEALSAIAKAGNGNYQNLYNTGKVANQLVDYINNIEKRTQGSIVFTQYKSYYQVFLTIALLLLTISIVAFNPPKL